MNKYFKNLLYLGIMGVGLGVILGSLLNIIIPYNPQISIGNILKRSKHLTFQEKNNLQKQFTSFNLTKLNTSLSPKKYNKIEELTNRWETLANQNKGIQVSGFLYLIDEQKFADFNSEEPLPSASSIKIPILIILLSKIDKGEIEWDEQLKLTKEIISSGSGWMAYQPLGQSFPVYEAATEMIRVSDNTATNLLIKRLGGIKTINKYFKDLGLRQTQIKNFLPDLEGTNLTTTKELAFSLALVDSGKLLSQRSRDLFREVMSTSKTNRMLPKGLLRGLGINKEDVDYRLLIEGYMVYNKTGDIGISYSDSGLIQMPNNTRAVASFIVKGPFNDPRSPELIRRMAAEMVPFLKPKKLK